METLVNLIFIWLVINLISVIGIVASSLPGSEPEWPDILFFPGFIYALRKKLNKIGTAIVTVLFSIFFAPALISYFAVLIIFSSLSLPVLGFIHVFKRKDI